MTRFACILFFLLPLGVLAQHPEHQHHPPQPKAAPAPKPAPAARPKAAPAPQPRPKAPAAPAVSPRPAAPLQAPAADTTLVPLEPVELPNRGLQADTTNQQPHHHPAPAADTATQMSGHEGHSGPDETMSHSFSRSLPMNRNGSGTSWQPDATPMYGYMAHRGRWMFMTHGSLFLRYTNQDINNETAGRGDKQFDAPNWLMTMGQRPVGANGLFRFSVMLSLDELIMGGSGYPLLFQSGETYQGRRLIDRQHPHDLLSELSVGYTQRLSPDADAFVYLGYPGEPAIGPTAFMHRISAFHNPNAGLGHHWQDATHITFGVATAGFRYRIFKLEGSGFTGREPNEDRYDFDKPRFDSYSVRLSANPTDQLALQVSRALVKSPEALEPGEDVNRTTASVLHSLPLPGTERHLTSALVWGLNDAGHGHREHSALAETNLQLGRAALYGRYEWVQKSPEELELPETEHDQLFNMQLITLGANYRIFSRWNTNLALGAQGTLYVADTALEPVYGRYPLGAEIYLHITPGLMMAGSSRSARQMSASPAPPATPSGHQH